MKKNKWVVLITVSLAFSFAFLIRYIWSPLMLDAGAEFSLSSFEMGLYSTSFMVGYLIMQIPGGILADRYEPKYLLMGTVGAATLLSFLFAATPNYSVGLVLRILEGLCFGGVYSSCAKIVYQYFEPKERAVPMGMLLSSPSVGILLANTFGEPLNEVLGWRGTVASLSSLGIVIVLLLLFGVEKPQAKAKASSAPLLEGVKIYVSDRQQMILGVSGLLLMFSSVAFATWMNTYMKADLGYPGSRGGLLLTFYSFSSIFATCVSGGLVKKLKIDPRVFVIVNFTLAFLCNVAFAFTTSYGLLVVIAVIYGMAVNFPNAHLVSFCIQRCPERHIATATAFENLVFQLGAAFQSAIIGAAATKAGNYRVMWYIYMAAGILSVLLILLYRPSEKK